MLRLIEQIEAEATPIGQPLAAYLASDDAAVVTGQAYNIDSGQVML